MNNEYLDSGRRNQKLKTRNLICAAAQEFLNEGRNFTLEDVANKAGLSRATVYRYYSSVEVLSTEAVLDLNVQSPENLVQSLEGLPLEDTILGIQDYFNQFTIENEAVFRKFLSIAIRKDIPQSKRGARRPKALQLAIQQRHSALTPGDAKNLIHVATVLMGMEAMIVTKDVCQLDDQDSLSTLRWGLEMMIKGIFNQSDYESST